MFSCRLYEYRLKAGLTQEQLAKKLGVSQNTISAIENGYSYPRLGLTFRILEFFKISFDELFYFQEVL